MIYINTFDIRNYDIDAIQRQFDIFKFNRIKFDNTKKDFPMYKLENSTLPVQAITKDAKRNVFVLVYKDDISFNQLNELEINNYELVKIDLHQPDNEFYKENIISLFMCFVGSQGQYDDMANIQGELFLSNPKYIKEKTKYVVKVTYRYQKLELNVQTFRRILDKDDVNFAYYWPKTKLIPIKTYNKEKQEKNDLWIKGNPSNSKNNISYIKDDIYESLNSSKIGMFYEFMKEFNSLLKGLVSIQFSTIESSKVKKYIPSYDKDSFRGSIKSYFDGRRINIVDLIEDDKSSRFIDKFKEQVENMEINVKFVENKKALDGYNFILIRTANFYSKNNIGDRHIQSQGKIIAQNITYESIELSDSTKIADSLILMVLHEFIVKEGILKKQLAKSLVEEINIDRNLYYISAVKVPNVKKYYFVKSKVTPKGVLSFEIYDESEFKTDPKFNEIIQFMLVKYFYYNGDFKRLSFLDGIMYHDMKDICVIFNDGLFPIPDVSEISEDLSKSKDEKIISKDKLISHIKKIDNGNKKLHFQIGTLLKILKNMEETFSLKDLRKKIQEDHRIKKGKKDKSDKGITGQSSIIKILDKRLEEEHEKYKLYPENRKKVDFPKYEGLFNINYIDDIPNYIHFENSIHYWVGVGNGSIKKTYNKAPKIRSIYMNNRDDFDIKKFTLLLDNDFVRIGLPTVKPFLAKYNREYFDMIKNKI